MNHEKIDYFDYKSDRDRIYKKMIDKGFNIKKKTIDGKYCIVYKD